MSESTATWSGWTFFFRTFPSLIEPDILLVGRETGLGRSQLEALNAVEPAGFAVLEVDHPQVRWVVVRQGLVGLDVQEAAKAALALFGFEVPADQVGLIVATHD